jgi:hypothetical protein
MSIVLGTNVLVSGIFWGGQPRRVLELRTHDRFAVLGSADILKEYASVMKEIGGRRGGTGLADTSPVRLTARQMALFRAAATCSSWRRLKISPFGDGGAANWKDGIKSRDNGVRKRKNGLFFDFPLGSHS